MDDHFVTVGQTSSHCAGFLCRHLFPDLYTGMLNSLARDLVQLSLSEAMLFIQRVWQHALIKICMHHVIVCISKSVCNRSV